MLVGKAATADAVWHSNRKGAASKASLLNALPKSAARAADMKATKMPQFVAPQLCKRVSRPPAGEEWVHEIKLDGYRTQLRVADGKAVMRTRKGLDWTTDFAAIVKAASDLQDCILDGEVVALDHNGAPDFAALQVALSEGRSKDLTYFVFDLLFSEGKDLRGLPLIERKKRLQRLLEDNGRPGKFLKYVEHLAEPGDAVLQSACRLNLEGIISKCASAPYQSGRTDTWLKAKCRGGQEVVIGGWSGSSRSLRSLLVGVSRVLNRNGPLAPCRRCIKSK
jgi:bifunctional non-homologous end joining protein LigD